jgi:hypothetical protein
MSQSSLRKALFVAEMVFSLLFLVLCFFAIHLPLRVVECSMNHGKLEGLKRLPEITQCLQWCLPEGMAVGILGPIAVAIGFASVASLSAETLSSRLFRWFLIPLGFAIFASVLPLAESYMCLCSSNHDDAWLDEVCFMLACLALGFAGWKHARKIRPSSASELLP